MALKEYLKIEYKVVEMEPEIRDGLVSDIFNDIFPRLDSWARREGLHRPLNPRLNFDIEIILEDDTDEVAEHGRTIKFAFYVPSRRGYNQIQKAKEIDEIVAESRVRDPQKPREGIYLDPQRIELVVQEPDDWYPEKYGNLRH